MNRTSWNPGPLGWLTLALLAGVAGLWSWVGAQEAAPMLETSDGPVREEAASPTRARPVVIDPRRGPRGSDGDSDDGVTEAPFEIWHNGKQVSKPRMRTPVREPEPVYEEPAPQPAIEVAPAPQLVPVDVPDLRQSLPVPAPVESDLPESTPFESSPFESTLPVPAEEPGSQESTEDSKQAAIELLHRARDLARQGSYESATWLILRAQQIATWTDQDELTPDQVLVEVQTIQAEDPNRIQQVNAETVTESLPPATIAPAAPAEQHAAEQSGTPVIVQMPAPPAPVVTRATFDDLALPIAIGSLVVGTTLLLFMVCGGAIFALFQRMTKPAAGPLVYRLELAAQEGSSLLGPIQIVDNRPATAPVMYPMMPGMAPGSMPGMAPTGSFGPQYAEGTESDVDARSLEIPENPMLLPFSMMQGATFADEQAEREEQERQREQDLIKHIFDKNVELQAEIDRLDAEAA